jgi:hypothetical protein
VAQADRRGPVTIADFFGEDAHTGKEDSYVRILKARKWVVLSAVIAVVYGSGDFTATPFSIGVGDVSLSNDDWMPFVVGGLFYTHALYLLLFVQLGTRYPKIMAERLKDKFYETMRERSEEASELQNEIASLEADMKMNQDPIDLESLGRRHHHLELELKERQIDFAKLMNDGPEYDFSFRLAEVLIDAGRILSPGFVSYLAAMSLISLT